MSELWAGDLTAEEIESLTDIAELVVTKKIGDAGANDPHTRNRSLSAMRRVLVDAQNVMVAVGGKFHSADGFTPGVGEEMTLAEKKGIPCFLVAGLGGFARNLARDLTPTSLNNSLSQEANIELFGTDDVSACVSLVFDQLAESKALAQSAVQPIMWNAELKVILDHRDGTIRQESTGYISRTIAV
jgi:hypothetical protein